MKKKELSSTLDKEIVDEINQLSEKSYFDILIEDIYIFEEIKSDRDFNRIKIFVEVSSMETWIETPEKLIFEELSKSLNSVYPYLDFKFSNHPPSSNYIKLLDVVKENELEYKKELINSETVNVFNNNLARNSFNKINKNYEEKINSLMFASKMFLGNVELSIHLENIGGLIFKMTSPNSIENIHLESNEILLKVEKGINLLSKNESLTNKTLKQLETKFKNDKKQNPLFNWNNFEDFKTECNDFLTEYMKIYSEIPVYNDMQYGVKYATIYLAGGNYEHSLYCLNKIKESLDDNKFNYKALTFKQNYEYQSLSLVKNKIKSRYKKELSSINVEENDIQIILNDMKLSTYSKTNETEPNIIKELLKYAHLQKKRLLLSNKMKINKKAFLSGGFKEDEFGNLYFDTLQPKQKKYRKKL